MIWESILHATIPSIVKFEQGILRDLKIKHEFVRKIIFSVFSEKSWATLQFAGMHMIESSLWPMAYDKSAVTLEP